MKSSKGHRRKAEVNQKKSRAAATANETQPSGREAIIYQSPYETNRVNRIFFERLLRQTDNFSRVTWLGKPIWQNILDLWVIQETIWEIQPELLIECGTNRGGSAYFYAQLFDLMKKGKVISIDITKMHDLTHPRIEFIVGSSVDKSVVGQVKSAVSSIRGPVMVILDSDHAVDHVSKELEMYSTLVTRGSFILVQDGVIDNLPMFSAGRPGPLPAIKEFLVRHPEFEVDIERSERFLISHHPLGWLRRG